MKLPWVRLYAYVMVVVVVAAVGLFVVGIATNDNGALMGITGVILFVPGIYFINRWWLSACRTAGVPRAEKPTRKNLALGVSYLVSLAATVFLECVTYDATGNRALEGTIGFVLAVSAGIYFMKNGYLEKNPIRPGETQLLRGVALMYVGLTVIFAGNLILQLSAHHLSTDLTVWHNVNIAAFFALTPSFPINAYFTWRRYLRSRAQAEPGYA